MDNKQLIKNAIEKTIKQNRKIIIYPFGYWGGVLKEILNNKYGVNEYCIIDNEKASSNNNIKQIGELSENEIKHCSIIVACINTNSFTEIIKTIEFVDKNHIIDVFEEEHFHIYRNPEYILYLAEKNNLSLSQWYERHLEQVGRTDIVVQAIEHIIDISRNCNICEIGPGTGRYMERFIKMFKPQNYSFYEIQPMLREYLVKHYKCKECNVIAMETDGKHLLGLKDNSQDIVFANSVWPIVKYSNTYTYFLEMIRVCRKNGYVIFDAYTEKSYTKKILEDEHCLLNEWRLLPEKMIKDTFKKNNMKLLKVYEFPYINFNGFWYIYQKKL